MGAVGAQGAIDPATSPVTGMTLWLRGDVLTESGGAVSQWTDQSGNANHYKQPTAGNKPTYAATGGPNSLPIVDFDGSNDKLSGDTGASDGPLWSALVAAAAGTLFLVCKWDADSTGTGDPQNVMWADSVAQAWQFGRFNSLWSFRNNGTLVDNLTTSSPAFSTGTWYGMEIRLESNTTYLRVSGGAEVSMGSSNIVNRSGTSLIGADGANVFGGKMAELLIYNTALSSVDRQSNRDYLAIRYSITW